MTKMELMDKQLFLLKSQFYDLIEYNRNFHYGILLNEMLKIIKEFIAVDEIRYYHFNESDMKFYMEASTEGNLELETQIRKDFSVGTEWFSAEQNIIRNPFVLAPLDECDVLLPLRKEGEVTGFLAMKGVLDTQDGLLLSIVEECQIFLHKIKGLTEIIVAENRYKQLFRVTEKFHSSMNMDAVLGEVIETLQEVYPSFTYYLMLSHDNNSHGDLPIKDLEYDSENFHAMQAYVTGNVQLESFKHNNTSILYAPLKGKQGVYGVLQVIAPNAKTFPDDEVEFINLLANTAGSALENAQLYQQSRRLISDLQMINETSHKLNSNLRLNESITFMTEKIISSFDAEEVGFILVTEDFRQLKVIQGSTPFFFCDEVEMYLQYLCEKIIAEKDSLFIGDLNINGQAEMDYKSIMAVPMVQTGVIKGFAVVMHRDPYHFKFETFKLLQSLIHHSTLAFTNSILREELEKSVITDHLTRLYSRNYLDDKIQRSMHEDDQGTFILIDIDNFKHINDTYGHQVGDEILIQVASIITANIRDTDIGSRWGGEELAVYLPKVPLITGLVIAERLVEKVRTYTNPKITISCGVSSWQKEQNDTFPRLFKRADKALYKAKETGKNRVVVQ